MRQFPERKETGFLLFARVSADDVVLYVNAALAGYLGAEKDVLAGVPLESLAGLATGEVPACFEGYSGGGSVSKMVVDGEGRVFELARSCEGGVLDIVLVEVTDARGVLERFGASIAVVPDELSEAEMRGILYPSRRILTVSRTRMAGLNEMAGANSPSEVRLLMGIFSEECGEAILDAGGCIGSVSPDEVEGIFGAPRYYEDHALRALGALVKQFEKIGKLRKMLHRMGKEIPSVAAGIAGGEVLLSPAEARGGSRISVAGHCAVLASQLSRLARPGEILISQLALNSLFAHLPEGWTYAIKKGSQDPDISDVAWGADDLQPLPENLQNCYYILGPGAAANPSQCEYLFEYLYSVGGEGAENFFPVLRVVPAVGAKHGFSFSDQKVAEAAVVQILGKYKLLQVVGQGGMGKVWKAQDRFGNTVAIKVLNSAETASKETVLRFKREAEIMARLPHRNICRVFEISAYEGVQFIAMEYIDGLTLADLLYEGMEAGGSIEGKTTDLGDLIRSLRVSRHEAVGQGRQPIAETHQRPLLNRVLPLELALSLFGKICEAVQFAHEHGILHRDLKPGNVLLREDGEPLVADFGLAKLEKEDDEVSLSISGHVVGTIENMAPEQAESSKDVDERADVFSLGTILYQVLTGHRHFQSCGNILQDAQRLKTHEAVRPRQLNRQIDPDLELICLKALRADLAERYRSVAALKADIERYRRGENIAAKPVTTIGIVRNLIRRHRAVAAAISIFLLLFSGLAAVAFWQINEQRIEAQAALRAAEEQALLAARQAERADAALANAEKHRLWAQSKQEEAEEALAQGRDAWLAYEKAVKETEVARQETEEERDAKIRLEDTAKHLREKLAVIVEKPAEGQQGEKPPEKKQPEGTDPKPIRNFLLSQADRVFAHELSKDALAANRGRPEEIQRRIFGGLSLAAQTLALEPRNSVANALKGKFHLALHEIAEARESFGKASEVMRKNRFLPKGAMDMDEVFSLYHFLQGLELRSPAPVREAVEFLKKQQMTSSEQLVDLMRFPLPGRVACVENGFSSQGREETPGEALLDLQAANPGAQAVYSLKEIPEGVALTVENAKGFKDFTALAKMRLRELNIDGATGVDLDLLGRLGLLRLAVTNSKEPLSPTDGGGGFAGLVEAKFRNTVLSGIGFLAKANSLEWLDLSETKVVDLSPLNSSKLRYLDISGTRPSTLLCLSRLPIEEIVLDPQTAADTNRVNILRYHKTLQSIRVPGEFAGQSQSEFWRKQGRGEYGRVMP